MLRIIGLWDCWLGHPQKSWRVRRPEADPSIVFRQVSSASYSTFERMRKKNIFYKGIKKPLNSWVRCPSLSLTLKYVDMVLNKAQPQIQYTHTLLSNQWQTREYLTDVCMIGTLARPSYRQSNGVLIGSSVQGPEKVWNALKQWLRANANMARLPDAWLLRHIGLLSYRCQSFVWKHRLGLYQS